MDKDPRAIPVIAGHGPFDVTCEECHAAIGKDCLDKERKPMGNSYHAARLESSKLIHVLRQRLLEANYVDPYRNAAEVTITATAKDGSTVSLTYRQPPARAKPARKARKG